MFSKPNKIIKSVNNKGSYCSNPHFKYMQSKRSLWRMNQVLIAMLNSFNYILYQGILQILHLLYALKCCTLRIWRLLEINYKYSTFIQMIIELGSLHQRKDGWENFSNWANNINSSKFSLNYNTSYRYCLLLDNHNYHSSIAAFQYYHWVHKFYLV